MQASHEFSLSAGKFFINFSPAVSDKAVKAICTEIRSWNLHLRSDKSSKDLSRVQPDHSRLAPVLRTVLPVGALSANAPTGSIAGLPAERFEVRIGKPHRQGLGLREVPRAEPTASRATRQARTHPQFQQSSPATAHMAAVSRNRTQQVKHAAWRLARSGTDPIARCRPRHAG